MIRNRNSGGGGRGMSAEEAAAMDEERRKILEERQNWEQQKEQMTAQRNEEEYQRAMAAVDNSILDLLPKIKEAKTAVDLMNRVTLTFDVVLEKGHDAIPKVKINVENSGSPKLSIVLDPNEFLPKLSILKDEHMKLKSAIDGGRAYEIPERHDPLYLMFDNDYHLGTATHWPEYLLYNLDTGDEDKAQDIKNVAVPYNTVGMLEVVWTPLGGPDPGDETKPVMEVNAEEDLLGKPWTYQLEIRRAAGLPIFCEVAYVSYDFFGEACTTEAVQQTTSAPIFEYKKIHHIPSVSQEFINYLKGSVEMQLHVTQHIDTPQDKISTANPIVAESIRTGNPLGYEHANAAKPKTEAELRCEHLTVELAKAMEENAELKRRVQELEAQLAGHEGNGNGSSNGHMSGKLKEAKLIDSLVNGEEAK